MWSESSTSVKQHSVTNFLPFVILTINYSTPTYHPVWLVFLGSIPTCACFHSENFLWLIKLLVLLCNYTKGVSRVLDTYYGRFQFCSNVPYSVSWQLFSPKEGSRKLCNLDYTKISWLQQHFAWVLLLRNAMEFGMFKHNRIHYAS